MCNLMDTKTAVCTDSRQHTISMMQTYRVHGLLSFFSNVLLFVCTVTRSNRAQMLKKEVMMLRRKISMHKVKRIKQEDTSPEDSAGILNIWSIFYSRMLLVAPTGSSIESFDFFNIPVLIKETRCKEYSMSIYIV